MSTLMTASIDPTRFLSHTAGLAMVMGHFAYCKMTTSLPRSVSLDQRLAMLPRQNVPLAHRVVINWSARHIPFIEAESDTDLATALGFVQAHLRIGQMEMLRHLSQGRVSELIGPIAIDFDFFLRSLAPGRAVPLIMDGLPTETRTRSRTVWPAALTSSLAAAHALHV